MDFISKMYVADISNKKNKCINKYMIKPKQEKT